MITISKTRVLKTPKNVGDQVILYIPVVAIDHEVKSKYGLHCLTEVGQSMVPKGCGTATRRNVEGKVIIHKNRPKETYDREYYWCRQQWAVGGGTETVSGWVSRQSTRYPRTYLPAVNMELQLQVNREGEKFYATEIIKSSDEYRLVTAINMMLEIFGYVYVADAPCDELITPIKIDRKVTWKLLPKGTRTIEQLKKELRPIIDSTRKKTARALFFERLAHINEAFEPKTVTMGLGGFNGYVAFTFEKLGFTILECIYLNNATYVFNDDWEMYSQMSKTQILDEGLASHRIIHNGDWLRAIDNLLQRKLIA